MDAHGNGRRVASPDDGAATAEDTSSGGVLRRIGSTLGLLVLVASAAYGGDLLGVRSALQGSDAPAARPPAVSRVAGAVDPAAAEAERTRVRSAPWWQALPPVAGTGAGTHALVVDEAALQWRATWACDGEELVVDVVAEGAAPEPLLTGTCPGSGTVTSTLVGPLLLDVRADGPWELRLEQQIDVPLVEPPLPAMTADGATEVASGTFYDVDQTGRGEVTITKLPDGSYALRLDGFFVTPNIDLEVRLSPVARPTTVEAYRAEPSELVAELHATAGSMNFTLPAGIDPADFRSVVIWCPPVQNLYAAASLAAAG